MYPIAHSDLELEYLGRAEGIDWSNHRLGMAITKALMPIGQREHGTIDVRLEMIVDGRATTEPTRASLNAEMFAEQILKVGTCKTAATLKKAC